MELNVGIYPLLVLQDLGFKTPGNARDIPFYNNYPRGFQIIRNTPEFIPEPGDIAVWTGKVTLG